ncbi:DEAD/DEAH box helicase [Arcanobacterium hippocoleae]
MTEKIVPALSGEQRSIVDNPLEKHVSKRSANALAKLGLHTVNDLLEHVPFRLAKRGELMPIERVSIGQAVTVVARVTDTNIRQMHLRNGYILHVLITDGTHDLSLTFFARNMRPLQFHVQKLKVGTVATFSGTISEYRGQLQLSHPDYEVLQAESEINTAAITAPVPIYHASAKLPSWQLARAVQAVLPLVNEHTFPEILPAEYLEAHGLPARAPALRSLHLPQTETEWVQARKRMAHEEAFVLQTLLATRAVQAASFSAPAAPKQENKALQIFDARLPFALTAGQKTVGAEIDSDLAKATPMRRLLQGDVGTGKTIVALRAMLQVIDNGRQAVLLAPTEVLAEQHYASITALLGDLAFGGTIGAPSEAITVELLTGSVTPSQKKQAYFRMASGQAQLIIGTHALLEDRVQLPFLGLVVIDEQHRFGVDQRNKLAQGVHLLVMTATPIPRTIAMTVFGDLEVSTLKELPKGRKPISTMLVPAWNEAWMRRVWQRASEEIAKGGRVYAVCPRISEDSAENVGSDEADNIADFANSVQRGKLPRRFRLRNLVRILTASWFPSKNYAKSCWRTVICRMRKSRCFMGKCRLLRSRRH